MCVCVCVGAWRGLARRPPLPPSSTLFHPLPPSSTLFHPLPHPSLTSHRLPARQTRRSSRHMEVRGHLPRDHAAHHTTPPTSQPARARQTRDSYTRDRYATVTRTSRPCARPRAGVCTFQSASSFSESSSCSKICEIAWRVGGATMRRDGCDATWFRATPPFSGRSARVVGRRVRARRVVVSSCDGAA